MKIGVVGDLLLDVDWDGAATRLCPDAPVPVIDLEHESARAGGAGLVATLLAADGHDVTLVTAMASDEGAARLRSALAGVTVAATELHGPTPAKTRLRANGLQVARIDTGCQDVRNARATRAMLDACAEADALVVADYGHGLLNDPLLRRMLRSRSSLVPVVWDPHPRGAVPVPGVAAVTPNLGEALGASGETGQTVEAAARAARKLLQRWNSRSVVVTMADRGALMLQATGGDLAAPLLIPAPRITVPDPCGAGDRFASALAVLLAQGQPISTAVEGAVNTTSEFLGHGGVASLPDPRSSGSAGGPGPGTGGEPATGKPTTGKPAAEGNRDSGATTGMPSADGKEPGSSAFAVADRVRARDGTVVATGGCFDLLHAGHVRMLAQARELGDCLVVLLNSDASVSRMKGPERPIMAEADRVEMLRALASVDAVVVFDEDTPEQALQALRPDVWVKGADYSVDRLPEARALQAWGGQAVTVPYHPQHSTTLLAQALARAAS